MKRGLDAMEIMDRLQTLADKRGVSLNDLVEKLLEGAGARVETSTRLLMGC